MHLDTPCQPLLLLYRCLVNNGQRPDVMPETCVIRAFCLWNLATRLFWNWRFQCWRPGAAPLSICVLMYECWLATNPNEHQIKVGIIDVISSVQCFYFDNPGVSTPPLFNGVLDHHWGCSHLITGLASCGIALTGFSWLGIFKACAPAQEM